MKLLLKRRYKKSNYTIGDLYIDGEWFSNTLEDKDRGLSLSMSLEEIKRIKVPNETAIPAGTYNVTLNVVSPKFKDRAWAKPYGGKVPRILNVPGFEGVLIHPGTDLNSTSGCIILGKNKIVGKVINSLATFHKLMSILKGGNNITITIK